MRNRPWVIIMALSIALFLYFGNRWYRSPKVQKEIRESVEATLSDLVAGSASIDNMDIGLLSVSITNLDVEIPLNSVSLKVKNITIGFSLTALIKRDWRPQELIDKISLVSPIVTITSNPQQNPTDSIEVPPINDLVPFRKASIKDATIIIKRASNFTPIAINGLDGTIEKEDGNAVLSLSASIGKLSDNIFINGILSDTVAQQNLSIRLKDVPLDDIAQQEKIHINGKVDASIEANFVKGVFPQNIRPIGWLNITDISIENKKVDYVSNGEVNLIFDNDTIFTKSAKLEFPNGKIDNQLSISMKDRINGELHSTIMFNGEKCNIDKISFIKGKIESTIKILNVSDTLFPYEVNGHINKNRDQFSFNSNGILIPNGLAIRELNINSPYGKITSRIAFQNKNLIIDGKMFINKKINNDIMIKGTAPFNIQKSGNKTHPEITIDQTNVKLISSHSTLKLPLLHAETKGKSLLIWGNDSTSSLSININDINNPLENIKGKLSINNSGITSISQFISDKKLVHSGNFTLDFFKNKGITKMTPTITVDGDFGKLSLSGNGLFSNRKNQLKFNNCFYQYDTSKIPFNLSIDKTKKGWQAAIFNDSMGINGKVIVNEALDRILSGEIKTKKTALSLINVFIEDSIVKSGTITSSIKFKGKFNNIKGNGTVKFHNVTINELDSLSSNFSINFNNNEVTVSPFQIENSSRVIVNSQDSTTIKNSSIITNVYIDSLNIGKLIGDTTMNATVIGKIKGSNKGIYFNFSIPKLIRDELKLDQISVIGGIKDNRLDISNISAKHENTNFNGSISYPLLDKDTLKFDVSIKGDLLNSAGQFKESPISGNGNGTITLRGSAVDGNINFKTARLIIPDGNMKVWPYVRKSVQEVYTDIKIFNTDSTSLMVRGVIGGKQVVIKNDYNYNKSLKPIVINGVNLGVIRVYTESGGVPLFIPGFLENRKGNVGYIEVAGKDSTKAFTLSGTPPNDFTVTGTLLLRKAEITFPLLHDVQWPSDFDPFPYVGFNLDIQAANQSVTYFYRMGNAKKRRAIKILECNLSPERTIGVRGRDRDGTFRVTGSLRSYKGFLFYGKVFDKNFELGLDFSSGTVDGKKHDNLPIIWGSAETVSDTNQYETEKVLIMTKDPKTGKLREKGRLTEIVIVPAKDINSYGEKVSAEEESADFYKSQSKELAGVEGAGNRISEIGDRYLSSYIFDYWGRQVATHIGLDVIKIETSFMNNAFNSIYAHQLDSNATINWQQMALNNAGITFGKYVAGDQLLLKMRTQFSSLDTTVVPEYKVGFEYQPIRYLWLDFNYGFKHDLNGEILTNPEVRLQFRMPFSKFQNSFKRDK